MTQAPSRMHVVIIGAGPVGLDAALAAVEAGWRFTVFEAASGVGGNVARWGHVRLFTPWSMNVSDRMARHLKAAGGQPPEGDECPTGDQLIGQLLEPLARLTELGEKIVFGTRVLGVAREGLLKHEEIGSGQRAGRPFRILVRRPDGASATTTANLVLDCTGTYETPNAAGDGGIPAPGEEELGERIVRRLPDLVGDWDAWRDQTVLLLGAGWSAQTAARDFTTLLPSAPSTRVIWAVRHASPDWGEVADDPLPERQALADAAKRIARGEVPGISVKLGAAVDRFKPDGYRIRVRLSGVDEEVLVDRVLALTGFVPDASLYRQLQVHECYATTAPMALAAQLLAGSAENCLEPPSYGITALRSPEPNFFILGAKSYGRNSEFLMRTGYDQVAEVANAYQP